MKKHLIHLLIAAGLLGAGCAKPLPDFDPKAPTGTGPLVEVVFSAADRASGVLTRATGITPAAEQAVGRWAVFAFDDESGWYAYTSSASGDRVTINLRAGRTYTCYAIVNYPVTGTGALNPAAVRTPSDLTGKLAYLSDNTLASLVMFGSTSLTPSAIDYDPASDTVPSVETTISVSRLVSRIDVTQVGVDFSEKPYLAAKTFTLRHIYITNAYRTTRYGSDYAFSELSPARSAWYNTMGWHRGEPQESGMDALLGDRGIDAVLSASAPHTLTHSFYAFPNPTPRTADRHDIDEWSIRSTRIILEATIDGDTVYYQINLPAMERNHIYSAQNIVIRGRGSNDPELMDVDPDVIDATIVSDDDWETGDDINL